MSGMGILHRTSKILQKAGPGHGVGQFRDRTQTLGSNADTVAREWDKAGLESGD